VSAAGTARGAGDALPTSLREALPVFFRFPGPRILAALAAGAGVARLALGGFTPWDAAVCAGIALLWPLQEWAIHVFVLHYRPRRVLGRTLDFDVSRKHRAHHRDPWRLDLVFIPTRVFLYGPLVLLAGYRLLLPTWELALTGVAFHLLLGLHYEWVHYLVHTHVSPRTALYRRLFRNHRLHHFKNERYWYGVTMLSGDRLLGTAPGADAVAASPTARALHAGPPGA
jgi:hypothetical protein